MFNWLWISLMEGKSSQVTVWLKMKSYCCIMQEIHSGETMVVHQHKRDNVKRNLEYGDCDHGRKQDLKMFFLT